MKHPIKDILAIFAGGATHTHEKAVQDTYDAGHAAGKAEAQDEFKAGLGSDAPLTEAPAAAAEGSTDEEVQDSDSKDVEAKEAEDPAPAKGSKAK